MFSIKRRFVLVLHVLIFLGTNSLFSQETTFECTFSQTLTSEDSLAMLAGAPLYQDTTLRVALFFVEFADADSNINARGSVGWSDIDTSIAVPMEKKYRRYHYWDMFFTKGTYIDANPATPLIHPDRDSHPGLTLATYGSMRDYYLENSNNNLEVLPAVTHPSLTDSTLRSGIINHTNSTDSSVIWVKLPGSFADYSDGKDNTVIMDDAIELGDSLFIDGILDVSTKDSSAIDRVLIYVAGTATGGRASNFDGRYSVLREKSRPGPETREYLEGPGGFAHEFGHQIGHIDLNDQGDFAKPEGVGYFSLMGGGTAGGRTFRPAHFGAWEKLQNGWLDYDFIESDTTNYVIRASSDTTLLTPAKAAILYGADTLPGPEDWAGGEREYFILENRTPIGFDATIAFGDQSFAGGMIAWHYHSPTKFVNGHPIRVIEADITANLLEGNLGTTDQTKTDRGAVSDFFPGTNSVTAIDDNTIPSFNLFSGDYSHYRLSGISYNATTQEVEIDSFLTTNLVTEITQNTTWNQNTTLTKELIIKDNATLTIEAGVVVTIDPAVVSNLRIIVEEGGDLSLNGTSQNPIVFEATADTSNSIWQGISFEKNSSYDLSHLTIRNATKALNFVDALSNKTIRGLRITNCVFAFTLPASSSNTRLVNLTVENVEDGGNVNGSNIEVDSSEIVLSALFSAAIPITISNSIIDSSEVKISGNAENTIDTNIFQKNSVLTLVKNGDGTIKNNRFIDGSNIGFNTSFTTVTPVIKNNVFFGKNKSGKAIDNFQTEIEVVNNTFIYYEYGFFARSDNPDSKVENNIFYENANSFVTTGDMFFNLFYNDIDPTGLDSSNIFADPLLVDPVNGDVHLMSTSPAIDSADFKDAFSNEPAPNGGRLNMGAYGNTAEATLSFDLIVQNNLTADATWSGSVNILESVSTSGNKLTLSPGTRVLFDDGKTLTVTATLDADGKASLPVADPILFSGYREADAMGGVYLYPSSSDTVTLNFSEFKKGSTGLYISELDGTQHQFDNLLFENNTTGFYSSESDFSLVNSILTSNEKGMVADGGDVTITGTDFTNNSIQGLHLYYADFDVTNSTFEYNAGRGVYFQYSSNGDFTDNTVSYNGSDPGESTLKGGVVCYQSSPFLEDNEITYNDANGILSLSSSYPTMTGDGYNLVAQNAGNSGTSAAEIFVEDISFPVLDRGNNDIADTTGGYLIYGDEDEREFSLYIRYNYWGETDSSSIAGKLNRPGGLIFYPFDTSSNTGSGLFSKEGSLAEADSTADFFERGLAAEREGKYADAVAHYDSLITLYPASAMSKPVMDRLYHVKLAKGDTPLQLQTYYSAFIPHTDTALATVAQRLAIRSLTAGGDYQDAINEHTTWSLNTHFESDSIYSQVDILSNQLRATGTPIGKMKAGKAKTKHLKKQQASFEETRIKTDALLSSLIRKGGDEEAAVIPEKFSLGQNYPNPFNPTTTITFQAPTKGNIQLEIFNVLGQKVKTLLNSDVDAGEYKLLWDSRNGSGNRVASGLYFYRAYFTDESGKQIVKSKKMILLR
ncbi:MAG: right-handed parallel beta-helix repeat-containing protein [Calditrichia bacterium]